MDFLRCGIQKIATMAMQETVSDRWAAVLILMGLKLAEVGSLAQGFLLLGFARDFWLWNRYPPSDPERANPTKEKVLSLHTRWVRGMCDQIMCIHWGLRRLPISFRQRFALLQSTGSSGPLHSFQVYLGQPQLRSWKLLLAIGLWFTMMLYA